MKRDTGDYGLINHTPVFKTLPLRQNALSGDQLLLSDNKVWQLAAFTFTNVCF